MQGGEHHPDTGQAPTPDELAQLGADDTAAKAAQTEAASALTEARAAQPRTTTEQDGQVAAADAYTGLDSFNSVADIGNDGNTDGRSEGFGGLLDEVQIYDRALTAAEILELTGQ